MNGPHAPGLANAVKAKLEREVFSAPCDALRKLGAVLVCDDWSLSILESVYKVNDLTKHSIPLVESIGSTCGTENGRQSLPRHPVIYMCRCTESNIRHILEDWTKEAQKAWEKQPYAEAHVFFTSKPSNAVTDQLRAGQLLLRNLKSLKDLNLDFLPVEPNVFTLEIKGDLPKFFGRNKGADEVDAAAAAAAQQILDVVTSMGDYVTVRHQKSGKCTAAYQIAKKVVEAQYQRSGRKPTSSGNNATLLVLDRSLDAGLPLLHELTYQAMVLDLLPQGEVRVEPDSIPGRARVALDGDARYPVDEHDELWCRFRHSHIADSGPAVGKELRELVDSSKALQVRNSDRDQLSTTDLSKAIREMPMLQTRLKRLQLHVQLHHHLNQLVRSAGLDTVCGLEQDLITNESRDGTKVDKDDLKQQMDSINETSGPSSTANKQRLLLLYIISQGVPTKDRLMKWTAAASNNSRGGANAWGCDLRNSGGTNLNQLIGNLSQLDVVTEKKKWYQPSKGKKKRGGVDQEGYDLSRYIPPLKSIVEHLVAGDLQEAECPHTAGEEGVNTSAASTSVGVGGRSQRPRSDGYAQRQWGSTLRGGAEGLSSDAAQGTGAAYPAIPWCLSKVKPGSRRFYVFVVGGATFSETRSVAEVIVEKEVEIIIGATSLLTPQSYLKGLGEL